MADETWNHTLESPNANDVKISIIIVNWNTRDFLGQCLVSIEDSSLWDTGAEIETIVVDNASIDGSMELIDERFPWVDKVQNPPKLWFCQGE